MGIGLVIRIACAYCDTGEISMREGPNCCTRIQDNADSVRLEPPGVWVIRGLLFNVIFCPYCGETLPGCTPVRPQERKAQQVGFFT